MVEVVGTAPTSAMVITKFVYRHSWKTNINNIKAFERDSIKIMKLTSEQLQEIKEQQSQKTKQRELLLLRLKIFYTKQCQL